MPPLPPVSPSKAAYWFAKYNAPAAAAVPARVPTMILVPVPFLGGLASLAGVWAIETGSGSWPEADCDRGL